MNLQLERLEALTDTLKLPGISYNAVDIAQQAAKREWDYLHFLEQILTSEQQHRDQRKQAMFTRMAGFPSVKTLEEFYFKFASGVPKAMVVTVQFN